MFMVMGANGQPEKMPDGVIRQMVATGIQELAERGDKIAQKCMLLIVMAQSMGLANGTDREREEDKAGTAETPPESVKPDPSPERPAYHNRVKPFMN